MKILLTLIGLVFILEGLPYLTFPEAMQRWLRQIVDLPPGVLRLVGLLAVVAGLALCYLTQRTDLLQ